MASKLMHVVVDCPRSLSANKLVTNQRWSLGPVLFHKEVSAWPTDLCIKTDLGDYVEVKKVTEGMENIMAVN